MAFLFSILPTTINTIANEYVNPKDFTVDWLSNNGDPFELFEIISGMPYYPIGIDDNGEYC
ncbi:hypothetical protein GCM10007199_05660 [Fictibacillus barbaricus]|nr:hypothetical protein GCM10007199_05660 [Fictibacillus barbaricus]